MTNLHECSDCSHERPTETVVDVDVIREASTELGALFYEKGWKVGTPPRIPDTDEIRAHLLEAVVTQASYSRSIRLRVSRGVEGRNDHEAILDVPGYDVGRNER